MKDTVAAIFLPIFLKRATAKAHFDVKEGFARPVVARRTGNWAEVGSAGLLAGGAALTPSRRAAVSRASATALLNALQAVAG